VHRLPGVAGEHGQRHPVEVALERRLRAVEVRVRVQVDNAWRRLAQPGDHTDAVEAAAAEQHRECPGVDRRRHALGDRADQVEAGIHLTVAGALERLLELDDLGLHRPAR